MKFSLLLGTYGSRLKELDYLFDSLDRQSYKNFELIVGSQTNFDEIEALLKEHNFVYKHVHAEGIGCSNSRNATMDLVSGDIYTFTDDDCWYDDKTLEIVKEYFDKYSPDIASFQHIDPKINKSTINYPKNKILGLNKRQLLKQATLDMWFNSNSIDPSCNKFDERFGIGTAYNSGEENIFIMDAYRSGIRKIFYFPVITSYHPYKAVNYIDENSFVGKGPLFKRLFGTVPGFFIFILFSIKKRKELKKYNEGKFFSIFIKAMIEQIKFKL